MADINGIFPFLELEGENNAADSRPVVFCNLAELRSRYQLWMANLPDIKPFFAVKSNHDPTLLKYLASLGTGFDCASLAEVKVILDLGASPDDIVFANTSKFESHLRYAAKLKVSLLTFDNQSELYKISSLHPTARLLIRIIATGKTTRYSLGSKFGCSISDSFKLLQLAKDLNLNVVGVSFHVGSYCLTGDDHCMAVSMAHEVFQYAEGIGFNFTILDIGGGFVGLLKETDIFIKSAAAIKERINHHFKDHPNLSVIAEPGTFMVTSCLTIATRIIGKRPSISRNNTMMYYINDGFFGYLNVYPFVDSPLTTFPVKSDHKLIPSFIWGATCDDRDRLGSYDLPNMEVGEWLLFKEVGAYSITSSRYYNGFEECDIFYCHDNGELSPKVTLKGKERNMDSNAMIAREVQSCTVKKFFLETLIANVNDTPVGFCDVSKVKPRWDLWKKCFPNIKPYYAVKSNSNPNVLKNLISLGAGFCCGSQREIERVMNLGVPSSDIVYNNTCKPIAHLKYASEVGVPLLTFDSESELHKIASIYPKTKLLIRLSSDKFITTLEPGLGSNTLKAWLELETLNFKENKHGCSVSESLKLLQVAHELDLDVVGVSFHISNDYHSLDAFTTLIQKSHRVFDHGKSVGFHFTHLNIGGGFSGNEYDNEKFIALSAAINKSIQDNFIDYPNLILLAEPGRFFVSSCVSIGCRIVSKRVLEDINDTSYYINDGFYGNLSGVLYANAVLKPFPLSNKASIEMATRECTVWGPTCDSIDKVGSFDLPTNLGVGDFIVFPDTGAYSFSCCSDFNGLGGPLDIKYYTEKF